MNSQSEIAAPTVSHTVTIQIEMEEELARQMQQIADESGCSLNEVYAMAALLQLKTQH